MSKDLHFEYSREYIETKQITSVYEMELYQFKNTKEDDTEPIK